MTNHRIAIAREDDMQGYSMAPQQIYQSWADQGRYLARQSNGETAIVFGSNCTVTLYGIVCGIGGSPLSNSGPRPQ